MFSDVELPQRVIDHITLWAKAENKTPEKVLEELIVSGACAKLVEETTRRAS